MTATPYGHIVVTVDKSICASTALSELVKSSGLSSMSQAAGRSQTLRNRKGLAALLFSAASLESSSVEVLSLVVPETSAEAMMAAISEMLRLENPGRGTIYSEKIVIYGNSPSRCPEAVTVPSGHTARLLKELMGIRCIVQRGKGDDIARVALDTGTCVPVTTFGLGTGVRDKLGILRITIPAEKEVITVVASRYDAEAVMNMMIDVGKLDLPGRGFIYLFPIQMGLVNTKVNQGMPSHAASVEQIIAALDDVKGGVGWRSRGSMGEGGSGSRRVFLSSLVDLTLVCNEGRGSDLVTAAMAVGAAGATISRSSSIGYSASTAGGISPAREVCSMVIGEKQIDTVVDALEKAGVFDNSTHGLIFSRSVPKACTYLGKK